MDKDSTITNPPICWIVAGANGSGKTTFALQYLPQVANCYNFINADAIAAGLSPLAPETALIAASRLFLQEIDRRIHSRQNFAFETTLSGRTYLNLIDRLHSAGWWVELIYLALPSVETSRMRVAERLAHGGHNIPRDAIDRRFAKSLRNLFVDYSQKVDRTECYMNAGVKPELIFIQSGKSRQIIDLKLLEQLLAQAQL